MRASITSERAAEAVGVSQVVGTRWFRHRSGMLLFMSRPISGRYISFAEREEIGLHWARGVGVIEIVRRLQVDFPEDESMRISHEAVYQALYIPLRGALECELFGCLRRGRALRIPRARARAKAWAPVSEEVMISNRPAEREEGGVPGHWERDLILGLNPSAIRTLVERSSRFINLVHLPREKSYGLVTVGPP